MSATTEGKLTELAAGQWGMFTAAQAAAAGIARSTLLRREQNGVLERVRHGVYRLPGAATDPSEDIRAAWLATAPSAVARDRLDHPDVVVGGAAAAAVHGLGDLSPVPYLLYTTTRRRSRNDDVRYSTRALPPEDVMVLDGLPVTTRERTIADLLDQPGADLTIVADALRDAEKADMDIDVRSLIEHLEPAAKGLGHGDGTAVYEHLRALTRLDETRLREVLAHTDLGDQVRVAVGRQRRNCHTPAVIVNMQVELRVHGRRGSAAHVTELLGVVPDEQLEIGDLKADGPRTFEQSVWNLFSMRHIAEVRAEHGTDPWGRVLWILRRLPADSAARISQLRDEAYDVTLSVSLITDHAENTFTIPVGVLQEIASAGLDIELSPVSTAHIDITYSGEW